MIVKFTIIFLLSFVESKTVYPSQVIITEVYNAYKTGKMIVPENNGYFIYDQKNYLKEKKNTTKIKDLYIKQNDIYAKNGIFNYFFIVDNIDEKVESLEDCAIELIRQISIYFNTTSSNTLIALYFLMMQEE